MSRYEVPPLVADQIKALKDKHGDIWSIPTVAGKVFVKIPPPLSWREYYESDKPGVDAQNKLLASSVVHPAYETGGQLDLTNAYPGISSTLSRKVSELAGARDMGEAVKE